MYLNIGHTGLGDQGFRAWLGETAVRPVYFVHDLIPITHPQFCRAGEGDRHKERMRTVLATGAGVIGNSQATLDSLAEFGRAQGLPDPPALAAWLGVTPLAEEPSAKDPAARPTFLVLGTIEARKNHLMLLQLWKHLIDRLGDDAPRLLVIGQRGWECDEVFDLLDHSDTLRGHVAELGRCDDKALARHLSAARALLFPSLAEGFGLPLVEALAAGTPVIASDLPVFREIGQGVPDLLDPLDASAWEKAILAYADSDSAARAAQLGRLAGFRPPTWDDHFASVESWLAGL